MAVALREITPGAARALDPEDAVQDSAVIQRRPSRSLTLWWEQWSQLAPLLVGQFIASYHTPFLPMDGSLRTQPSYYYYFIAVARQVAGSKASPEGYLCVAVLTAK